MTLTPHSRSDDKPNIAKNVTPPLISWLCHATENGSPRIDYVEKHSQRLSNLNKREALKILKKQEFI